MTSSTVRPHWSKTDERAGFFLLLVPTVGLAVSARDLSRRAQQAVDANPILSDRVTVGMAPIVDGSFEQDDAVATALIAGATVDGHLVSPRVVFGCLVVGPDEANSLSAYERLSRMYVFRALRVSFSGYVLAIERRRDVCLDIDDGDTAEENPPEVIAAVTAIVAFATQMIRAYESDPMIANGEQHLLGVLELLRTGPRPGLQLRDRQ